MQRCVWKQVLGLHKTDKQMGTSMTDMNPEVINRIQFLVGKAEILTQMPEVPALPMFSEQMVSFLGALSKALMRRRDIRENVDVMSYAYWIRKASLEEAKSRHTNTERRMGRGVAFHIAPSNVPVNFAVSMTSALLAGNACVIRVSDKPFKAVDMICEEMNRLLAGEFADLKAYFAIVRYGHDEQITQTLSSICDVRIIWGGDETIKAIRKIPLPTRAIEMTFADRHSLALIDAKAYLEKDPKEIAKGFYTDTYYSDQNACSSPRLVVWNGDVESVAKARERFWRSLQELVDRDYELQPVQAVDKMTSFTALAMSGYPCRLVEEENKNDRGVDGGNTDENEGKRIYDNKLIRVEVDKLTENLMDYKNGGGYFFEYILKQQGDLAELIPVLGKRCQTIAQLGFEQKKIADFVRKSGVRGGDRIVPLGQTMGLEFIWDGFWMIEQMSRYIYWN